MRREPSNNHPNPSSNIPASRGIQEQGSEVAHTEASAAEARKHSHRPADCNRHRCIAGQRIGPEEEVAAGCSPAAMRYSELKKVREPVRVLVPQPVARQPVPVRAQALKKQRPEPDSRSPDRPDPADCCPVSPHSGPVLPVQSGRFDRQLFCSP